MTNITLDRFWLSFMPMYQHANGITTVVLSILVIYLIAKKTPIPGRPLARYLVLMQMTILIVEFVSGFLVCPLFLSPLPAIICRGLLCSTNTGRIIAVVLSIQCISNVAITITLTLHFKYTTIVTMTNHRKVTMSEIIFLRSIFWAILELPIVALYVVREGMLDLHQFLLREKQFALEESLARAGALEGIAYSIPNQLLLPTTSLFGVPMVVAVSACAFCVWQTLALLSVKTTSMSERTRKMQQQLTYTLLMQLGIPLLVQVIPMSIILCSLGPSFLTPGLTNTVLSVQQSHSIFHTVFLILTTPSYRHSFTRCFQQPCETPIISVVENGLSRIER